MAKLSKVLSSMFLLISLIFNCNVIHAEEIENGSEIYQETGQIDLRVLDISYDGISDEIIVRSTPSIESILNKQLLKCELDNSSDYEEILKILLINGEAPDIIGYTSVYLKEVVDEDDSVLCEPMTINEYQGYLNNQATPLAIGDNSYSLGGNLTLHTGASFRGDDIYANSYATYSKNTVASDVPTEGCYDFIGITFPTAYTLKSGFGVGTSNYNTYIADEKDNSGLVAVMLYPSPSAPAYYDINLSGIGLLNGTKPSHPKIISSYCHTYGGINVSANISTDGEVSISGSGTTKYWMIYSGVTL